MLPRFLRVFLVLIYNPNDTMEPSKICLAAALNNVEVFKEELQKDPVRVFCYSLLCLSAIG